MNIFETKLMRELIERDSYFKKEIEGNINEIEDRLNRINIIFPTYTLHNIQHSYRVMDYMYDLIGKDNIGNFNDFEILLMIYAALLHDIGMSIEKDKIIEFIKIDKNINYNALLDIYGDEDIAIQDFVRRNHSKLSCEIIEDKFKDKFKLPDIAIDYSNDIKVCCLSHNYDLKDFNANNKKVKYKGDYEYNLLYISVLIRLGDLLDIDGWRAPDYLYRDLNLDKISKLEWKQHKIIYNKNKIINNDKVKEVILFGECKNEEEYKKILNYIEWMNYEILSCQTELEKQGNHKYKLDIKYPVKNEIDTIGFNTANLEFSLDYNSITNLLMGENIYGSKKSGLREVIQNSIDAIQVRKEIFDKSKEIWESSFEGKIKIIINENSNKFIIKDNGIGMNFEMLQNNFFNIGLSYYSTYEYKSKGLNYTGIGKFGIGFLACFMLSNYIEIKTRYFNDEIARIFKINKKSKYTFFKEINDINFYGTEIIFEYDKVKEVFSSNTEIENYIRNYFDVHEIDFEFYYNLELVKLIKQDEKIDNNGLKIDISKYLNGIDGEIKIKIDKNNIKQELYDVIPWERIVVGYSSKKILNKLYCFDGSCLKEFNEINDVGDYIIDSKLYMLRVLSVPNYLESAYDELTSVLDDEEECLSILEDKLEETIILLKNSIDIDFNHEFDDEEITQVFYNGNGIEEEKIIGNFKAIKLYEILDNNYAIKIERRTKNIFKIYGKRYVTGYNEKEERYWVKNGTRKAYLKDVWVPNERLLLCNIMNFIRIEYMKIKIKSDYFNINISRNHLEDQSSQELVYAISKIIYLFLIDEELVDNEEKNIINEFLNKYFSRSSLLLK